MAPLVNVLSGLLVIVYQSKGEEKREEENICRKVSLLRMPGNGYQRLSSAQFFSDVIDHHIRFHKSIFRPEKRRR